MIDVSIHEFQVNSQWCYCGVRCGRYVAPRCLRLNWFAFKMPDLDFAGGGDHLRLRIRSFAKVLGPRFWRNRNRIEDSLLQDDKLHLYCRRAKVVPEKRIMSAGGNHNG